MSNSRALVIKSIKHGETSLIVSCYLEEIGYRSFLVKGLYGSKKSRFSKAHFFPLNLINIHYSFHEKKNLGFIKEVKSEVLFNTIHSDVQKSSVIVFLSEILNNVFREELEVNQDLFDFSPQQSYPYIDDSKDAEGHWTEHLEAKLIFHLR